MKSIDYYKVIAFDCDGVLLDSNRIKTDAFYAVTLKYGMDFANQFRSYHVNNGGISRYKKFDHFFDSILQRVPSSGEKERLLADYADHVINQLMSCDVVEGLQELRSATNSTDWMVASGGDQMELRHVFKTRNLDQLFNRGIFGSPTPKDQILRATVDSGVDPSSMLMIGDSAFDHRAAMSVGADFVFASYWTEMPNWSEYAKLNGIVAINTLSEITSRKQL